MSRPGCSGLRCDEVREQLQAWVFESEPRLIPALSTKASCSKEGGREGGESKSTLEILIPSHSVIAKVSEQQKLFSSSSFRPKVSKLSKIEEACVFF